MKSLFSIVGVLLVQFAASAQDKMIDWYEWQGAIPYNETSTCHIETDGQFKGAVFVQTYANGQVYRKGLRYSPPIVGEMFPFVHKGPTRSYGGCVSVGEGLAQAAKNFNLSDCLDAKVNSGIHKINEKLDAHYTKSFAKSWIGSAARELYEEAIKAGMCRKIVFSDTLSLVGIRDENRRISVLYSAPPYKPDTTNKKCVIKFGYPSKYTYRVQMLVDDKIIRDVRPGLVLHGWLAFDMGIGMSAGRSYYRSKEIGIMVRELQHNYVDQGKCNGIYLEDLP